MPEVREKIRIFIKDKVDRGEATVLHDYVKYVIANLACKYSAEGHECFKAFAAGSDDEDDDGAAACDDSKEVHEEGALCPPAIWDMMPVATLASAAVSDDVPAAVA